MSGGNSNDDPYYQKDSPKRSKSKKEPLVPKTYKNAVKPKRIEKIPPCPEYPRGKTFYFYDCDNCGKEIKSSERRRWSHVFHDRNCQYEAFKKLWTTPEYRQRTTQAIRKATQTPEYRKKMSEIGKEVSSRPEWKEKQSKAHKGKKRPPEVGRKVSESKMGHEVSEETRRKLAEAARGDKSYFWKGGVSSKRQRYYRSWTWRKTAEGIKRRDNHTCQGCGWKKDEVAKLGVHHIDPLEDTEYDERNYPDELLVTLCEVCHPKSEYQDGQMKWPINGRDDEARLERLSNPKSWQTYIDEFSEPDDQ